MYFHISYSSKLHGKILNPRIPNSVDTDLYGNPLARNECFSYKHEDNRLPRVCFSTSIRGAFEAAPLNRAVGCNILIYVYAALDEGQRFIECDRNMVYDSPITHEVWCLEPVRVYLIGRVLIQYLNPTVCIKRNFPYSRFKLRPTTHVVEVMEDDFYVNRLYKHDVYLHFYKPMLSVYDYKEFVLDTFEN